ncbi:CPBP family intramembrane glutamic endopeptidase [Candidatus Halobonum tyrrellensis]|uniref:CAAX prenyl protease 2/Lysostaphin resistance protein A-like domain-containing protein n=1 Tax=Candidatus Halobonum tyrrellensis G22 TaxID=1324957 RepID=V4GT99_9EURY|nr:type II CAAX endopeptidase family protein [Candidatus Halobonum tyrrellensis]ESP88296.1 hypothetical protein K933_09242 [Candidatus Halobonum tyrrellensis G22]
MTDWTAFAAITGVVLALLLALARLSTSTSTPTASDAAADIDAEATSDVDPGGRRADGTRRPTSDAAGSESAAQRESARNPPPDPAVGVGARAVPTEDAYAPADLPPGALLLNVLLSQGLFATLLVFAAWWTRLPATALGLDPAVSPRLLAAGVGLGVALWVGNYLAGRLGERAGVDAAEGFRAALAPDSAREWALLLFAVLPLVALFEEFLFRAALVGALSAGFPVSPWLLAVGSSVAFALGHGAQGRVGMAVTGVLGFALAAGFVLTGSLAVVVVAHYLVNALEFVVHERPSAGEG